MESCERRYRQECQAPAPAVLRVLCVLCGECRFLRRRKKHSQIEYCVPRSTENGRLFPTSSPCLRACYVAGRQGASLGKGSGSDRRSRAACYSIVTGLPARSVYRNAGGGPNSVAGFHPWHQRSRLLRDQRRIERSQPSPPSSVPCDRTLLHQCAFCAVRVRRRRLGLRLSRSSRRALAPPGRHATSVWRDAA